MKKGEWQQRSRTGGTVMVVTLEAGDHFSKALLVTDTFGYLCMEFFLRTTMHCNYGGWFLNFFSYREYIETKSYVSH
jgi:hypothetical protein